MITCIFFFTISCVAHAQPKMIIGIAGGSGSGKTTLAHKILDAFPQQATLISQDSYYKGLEGMSEEQKAMANFDHPQALDFDLLKQHLIALKQGDDIDQPVYDFFTHTRKHHTTRVHSKILSSLRGSFFLQSLKSTPFLISPALSTLMMTYAFSGGWKEISMKEEDPLKA